MSRANDSIKKRQAAAKKICENYEYYKVCEGCESIVLDDIVFCPVCQTYRFDKDKERIIRTANELSQREQISHLPSDFI